MFLPIPDAFGLPKQAVFIILGFVMVAYSLMNKDTKTLTLRNRWLSLTFIYTTLSSLGYYFFLPLLFSKEKYIGFSISTILAMLTIILSILIIQTLVEWTNDLNRWVKTGKFLSWLGFGFSLYALIQFCGLDQIFSSNLEWVHNPYNLTQGNFFDNHRMITFLGNKRETACFLAILSPMCLMFKGLKYKIMYAVIALTILITSSFTGMFSLTAGFFLYLLLSGKWKLALTGILSTPLIGWGLLKINTDFFNFYGKGEIWKNVFLGTIPKFLFGHGLGSFPLLGYKKGDDLVINADFELLQLLSDGGLVLVILVIGYVITLYRRIFLEFLSSNSMLLIGYIVGLTTFLIIMVGASPLHFPALLLIGLCYVACLEAQTQGGNYA